LKVTVTTGFPLRVNAQTLLVGDVGHIDQPPNVDVLDGVAVSVIEVPLAKACVLHGPGVEQLKPSAGSETVPIPAPKNVTLKSGLPLPPPVPVKQTTFAVINPVTTAPDDDIPPALLPVVTVAEISVPPQDSPVAVSMPVVASTVNIWGVFDDQVT
jgi:hypothetical protein